MEVLRTFVFTILQLTSAVFYENNAYLQFMHHPPCCHKVHSQHQVHRITPFEHQMTFYRHHAAERNHHDQPVVPQVSLNPTKQDTENTAIPVTEETVIMQRSNSSVVERDTKLRTKTTDKPTLVRHSVTSGPIVLHKKLIMNFGDRPSSSSSESRETRRYFSFISYFNLSHSSLSLSSSESTSFYIPVFHLRSNSGGSSTSSSDSF